MGGSTGSTAALSCNRDGISLVRRKNIEDLILDSEIQGLKKLEFYVKMPEHNPAKGKLEITAANNRKAQAAGFILREGLDIEEMIAKQQVIISEAEAAKDFLAKTTKKGEKEAEQEQDTSETGGMASKDTGVDIEDLWNTRYECI